MKTISATTAVAAALAAASAASAEPVPLTVVVDGVEARGGALYVSVQTEADYMKPTGTEGSVIEGPRPGTHALDYEVEPGVYAVTVWHDDDANGRFDAGPSGMPLDGWALSGTVTGGAPTFEDAKVTVGEDGASTTVRMTYGR